MKDEPLTVTPGARRRGFRKLKGRSLRDQEDIKRAFLAQRGTRRRGVWVSRDASEFALLAYVAREPKGDLRLLVLEKALRAPQREYLMTLFRYVIAPDHDIKLLDEDQLVEVLNSDRRDELFIGAISDPGNRVIVLYRGDLDRLTVPWDWFTEQPSTEAPEPADVEVTDYGQTVRLGEFEAAADAILYELDAEYRRRTKRRAIEKDLTLGGSIRRLRLQKGLSRADFPGVSEREMARIERGEVGRPRDETLRAIATRLGVERDELSTY